MGCCFTSCSSAEQNKHTFIRKKESLSDIIADNETLEWTVNSVVSPFATNKHKTVVSTGNKIIIAR